MSEKEGNAVAVRDETEQVQMRVTTVDRRAGGGNLDKVSEARTAEVIMDPRWRVEDYMDRSGETLNGRRFWEMAKDGSNPYIYDLRRVRHETCVGAWRRRRVVFDWNRAVLLSDVPLSDMLFVRCEAGILYCEKLRDVMVNVGAKEIPAGVDVVSWYFERPHKKRHLFHGIIYEIACGG